tara:strand:- start:849 stop:1781 length:933 start_codon:yes stop_codon:yes gene_type:complete
MKNVLKIFFCILAFFFASKIYADENIFIKIKIKNEIITNFDLEKERKYLIALNPKLKNINKDLQIKIARESIIKEVIKKNELLKFFELNQKNEVIDSVIKNFYNSLGFYDNDTFNNYLNEFDWNFNEVYKKFEIETLWNQLIYEKYKNQLQIDQIKLKDKIEKYKNNEFKTLYDLSEIVFIVDKDKTFENTVTSINQSIIEIGFENTANLYSISDSSKLGGKIGWINENSLSPKILNSLKQIELGQFTQPLNLNSKFIILKINDMKNEKKLIDVNKELEKLIKSEENRQLNNFSKIYFDRIKINTKINEF